MPNPPRRPRRLVAAALVASSVLVASLLVGASAGPVAADDIGYTVSATSGQIVLRQGDPTYEKTIDNPSVVLSATVDNTTWCVDR